MKSYTVHGLFHSLQTGINLMVGRGKPRAAGRGNMRRLTSLFANERDRILADYSKMAPYFATCVSTEMTVVERWLKNPKGNVSKVGDNSDELHIASLYSYDRQFAASATARTLPKRIRGKSAFDVGVAYDAKAGIARADLAGGDFMLLIKAPVALKGVALYEEALAAFETFNASKALSYRAHVPVVSKAVESDTYGIDGWRVCPDDTMRDIEVMYATFENEFALSEKGVRARSLVKVGLTKGLAPRPKELPKVVVFDKRFIAAIFHKGCATPSFVASLDVVDWDE